MNNTSKLLAAVIAVLFLLPTTTFAQTPAPAAAGCPNGDRSHEFDFWIGSWDVTAGGQLAGHNIIAPILDGCVLQENWKGASGSAGSSLNYYNPQEDRWEQYWVWRNGTVIHTMGGLVDGKMVLEGESLTQSGTAIMNRITWSKDEEAGTVRQFWEISTDEGETWTPSFDGLYTRR